MTNQQFLALYRHYVEHDVRWRNRIFADLLLKSWCRETAHPDSQAAWSINNPALGQSSVTVLVTHDLFGGAILHGEFPDGSHHYTNAITSVEGYHPTDFTRSQFPADAEMPEMRTISRDALFHSKQAILAGTPERYALLRNRMALAMQETVDLDSGC